MDRSRYELAPGLWLDARRALWLAEARLLAIADLHLGYAWAHRHGGQLMPVSAADDTPERLRALVADYDPATVVLAGDIVHRAVPVEPLKGALKNLVQCLPAGVNLTVIAGNHDRDIERLAGMGGGLAPRSHLVTNGCVFVHGDAGSIETARSAIDRAREQSGWIVMGHEHPSVMLGDGVATWQKYPCFLVCEGLIVLPAFSQWAAGNSRDDYMSPLLECAKVKAKIAILGNRLVPLRGE
jgi:uncharacterized protein